MGKTVASIVAVYFVGAFLTGGYYFNHRCGDSVLCDMQSISTGMFWPVYWSGRASIEVTK